MVADKNDFETIRPAEISLTTPPLAESSASANGRGPDRWLITALIVAVLLALVVIFVLPELVRKPEPEIGSLNPPVETATPLKESPFQEAQLAEARQEAQKILARILEKKTYLESRQVGLWANDAFAGALAQAESGDNLYRDRQFTQALDSYRNAEQAMLALEQDLPALIQQTLEQGFAAIDAGQTQQAVDSFALALAMAPNNAEALKGSARAESLPRVLALLDRARQAEQTGDLDAARDHYQSALVLDAEHKRALQGAREIDIKIAAREFNRAMSRGFSALEANDHEQALRAFESALSLQPESSAAQSALTQARNRRAQATVQSLLQQGADQERREAWPQAVTSYQQVVDRDNSVIAARVGLIRARARASLNDSLEHLLGDPGRLSSTAVYRHARQVLADATAITDAGPTLKSQISQLQKALEMALIPVTVTLASDEKTSVTLFKIGALGSFSQRTLDLKPGSYVVTGSRPGYRDVRVEFEVVAGTTPEPVVVVCKEPV